jgi:hypothetical protein
VICEMAMNCRDLSLYLNCRTKRKAYHRMTDLGNVSYSDSSNPVWGEKNFGLSLYFGTLVVFCTITDGLPGKSRL